MKRFLCVFLTVVMCFSIFSPINVISYADSSVLTYDEVTAKIDEYMEQCEGRYWNLGLNKTKLIEYTDKGEYKSCTSTSEYGISNSFDGWQCNGFAKYLTYVIFGTKTRTPSDGWSDEIYSIGDDEVVHPGDYIYYPRMSTKKKEQSKHVVIVYKVEGDTVYLAESNWGPPNKISCNRTMSMAEIRSNINAEFKIGEYIDGIKVKENDHGFYIKSPATETKFEPFTVTLAKETDANEREYAIADTLRKLPKGTTLTIVDYTVNDYMNVWFQTDAGDWICSDCCVETADKPAITVSDQVVPKDQYVNDNCGLRGIISTDKGRLLRVYGVIYNSSNQAIQESKRPAYGKSFNIKDTINNDLQFKKLPEGKYTYKVIAAALNGSQATTTTVLDTKFTVKNRTASTASESTASKASTLSVSGASYPSGHYDSLRNFGLRGVFSSNYDITSIYAAVTDSSGATIMSYSAAPESKRYNIRYDGLNSSFSFASLPNGSYNYSVTATDSSGNTKTINSSFDIGSATVATITPPTPEASTLSVSGASYPSGHYDSLRNFGLRGVFTSNYDITSIYAAVTDSSGTTVMSYSAAPQSKSYDIRYDGLNNSFSFGSLSNGNYNYSVTATDSTGNSKTINSSFDIGSSSTVFVSVATPAPTPMPTVAPTPVPVPTLVPTPAPSTLSVSGADYPSGHFDSLRNYGLRGVFTSNYSITSIYAAVTDSSGATVMSYSAAPWSTSYDIRYDGLNNSFSFGSLSNGSYSYSVTATDSTGNTSSISSTFDIGNTSQPTSSASNEYPLYEVNAWMTVNVGKGSTLRFCSDVSTADRYELGSLSNGASVYVYGTTVQQYESRTWAKISYNGQDGWVNYKWLS